MSMQPTDQQSEAELTQQVRDFILETFPQARKTELRNNESLLDSGLVDSMGVLEIVTFLESDMGVVPSDEELLDDNFDTIDRIVRYVSSKRCSPTSDV